MAEIGLVRFAQVARQVAETALPRYRSKYSKHTFAQPTLLAVLCVMRYEDWTYRETPGATGRTPGTARRPGSRSGPRLHDALSLLTAIRRE
jgi:hypothetical protein